MFLHSCAPVSFPFISFERRSYFTSLRHMTCWLVFHWLSHSSAFLRTFEGTVFLKLTKRGKKGGISQKGVLVNTKAMLVGNIESTNRC